MIKDIVTRIETRLTDLGMSASEASRLSGMSKDAIRNIQRNAATGTEKGVSTRTIIALAKVLQSSPSWLLTGEEDAEPALERSLPVYGLAAGSLAGHTVMTSEPIEFAPCPPALTRVRDAYALMVTGSSMQPRYFAGDFIFIHPHRPVRPGDHAVIQVRRYATAETETWIKRYRGETEKQVLVEQYNPPSNMNFDRKFVVAVHRVLTVNELLGV